MFCLLGSSLDGANSRCWQLALTVTAVIVSQKLDVFTRHWSHVQRLMPSAIKSSTTQAMRWLNVGPASTYFGPTFNQSIPCCVVLIISGDLISTYWSEGRVDAEEGNQQQFANWNANTHISRGGGGGGMSLVILEWVLHTTIKCNQTIRTFTCKFYVNTGNIRTHLGKVDHTSMIQFIKTKRRPFLYVAKWLITASDCGTNLSMIWKTGQDILHTRSSW